MNRSRRLPATPGLHGRTARRVAAMAAALLLGLVASCGTPPPSPSVALPEVPPQVPEPVAEARPAPAEVPAGARELARNERLVLYQPAVGDSFASIAQRVLGRADLAWTLAEANRATQPQPGDPVVVPLKPLNPLGVDADSYQTVPILCYHRFGTGSNRMLLSPAGFAAQLDWLARNGFQVIRLAQLLEFLRGNRALPRKSVVITIDDGYESVHRYAWPLLKKYGFPATLFVYTDFIGYGEALSWSQLQELAHSGLIDIQAHSKTHRNLLDRFANEDDERYRRNLELEARSPKETLEKRLPGVRVRHFAYPFGDVNEQMLAALTRQQFELGLTVTPGGNAFFAQPLMLRRTMIFGDLDLEGFKAKLQIARSVRGGP